MILCPLKTLLKFRNAIWALVQSMGPWGVFVMALLDGAGMPLPGALDAVVVTYVHLSPAHAWLYVLLASVGSALGCLVLFFIGRAGGEVFIERRMKPEKFQKVRRDFDRHPMLTVALPSMVPPPFPFKIVVLSAGAFGMHWLEFEVALVLGRLVRFGVLALLTVMIGPEVVTLFNSALRRHPLLVLAGLAVAVGIVLLVRQRKRRPEMAETID